MKKISNSLELWRRLALLLGVLVGLTLLFIVTPAMVSISLVDWQQEQFNELKSPSGLVSERKRNLSQLALNDYVAEKTQDKVIVVDNSQEEFFRQVYHASLGEDAVSDYGNRVSKKDQDLFWQSSRPAEVFFKAQEKPFSNWGLMPEDGHKAYIMINLGNQPKYFLLNYYDYQSTIGGMYKPYKPVPNWLYHPYRKVGSLVIAVGLLLYLFLPRRKKRSEDISYSIGSMVAGDLVALILLVTFYGLPLLINGGTTQALTGMWQITIIMWFLSLFSIMLLYYNAWYASYRIELTEESICLVSFKGVKSYPFDEITQINRVTLRNPSWFRKLSLIMAFLSLAGGSRSTQSAGSALLTDSASYGGIEICLKNAPPLYIWFTNQNGGLIINNFDLALEALSSSGASINKKQREIEGFSIFM